MAEEIEDTQSQAPEAEQTVEAGSDTIQQPESAEQDSEQQPEPEVEPEPAPSEGDDDNDPDALSDDEELSDLDEEQLREVDTEIPIDEEVYKLSSHKRADRQRAPRAPKEKTRAKRSSARASATPKKTKQQTNDDGESSREATPEEELDPETRKKREIERRLDEAMKPVSKRRKKLDGDDIEQMQDEAISHLREQMRNSAIADAESIRNGAPAVNKLQLLPRVTAVIQKASLTDSILDNNLLEAVRMWLEPLPDASLPAYEIQKVMFAAIERLPIKTIHLRESGLGKVVYFYQRSKRPQLAIKRSADRLIGNWTRPIMGRSDNYRDKHVVSKLYNLDENESIAAAAKALESVNSTPTQIEHLTAAEAAAVRRNRAFIPAVESRTFQVAPKSHLTGPAPGSRAAPMGSGDEFKRLRQRIANKGRTGKSRKSGVSIEGKELH